jgi:hypothetical protein
MRRFFHRRNGKAGHSRWSDYLLRNGERTPMTRYNLAMAEAGRWLGDALVASPHAVYVRSNGVFEPAVVRGIEDAPSFDAEGSLPRALRRARRPVMTSRSHSGRLFDESLDTDDRSALRRTGAIALVPLDGEVDAFLLVGGPIAAFDPERLARALAPVSACLRIARDGAPGPGSEPAFGVAANALGLAFSRQ